VTLINDAAPFDAANGPTRRAGRVHRAWLVAAITFVTMLGAAAFRSVPSVFMDPLHLEFGWSHATIGSAMSINMTLFGLMSPFAAALMDRFGIRSVVSVALVLVAAGSGLTVFMTSAWQLLLCWGVLVGVGTGSMSMALVATVSGRWFVARRGLISGILTAATATGQLVFLPLVAALTDHHGWRPAAVTVSLAALAVVPLVLLGMRDHPHRLGIQAYGATESDPGPAPAPRSGSSAKVALSALFGAAQTRVFWLLAGSFAICGATTNGLIGTHFIPSAHDHGMPETTAAGLLAVVGIFDIVGTIASGWLTDRFNPKVLLAVYYQFRGVGLLVLPVLLGSTVQPSMILFVVVYGLDWVATVPPTAAICRRVFGADGSVVFGWVFAAHQLGAAAAALLAGYIRDATGHYTYAWIGAAAMCTVAAVISATIRKDAGKKEPVSVGA